MAKPARYTREIYDRYTGEGYWSNMTISDYWDQNARLYPDKEALVDSNTRLTWSQAKLWIDRLALAFLEIGLKKDDAVVIQLPNCVELACLRVACERAGLLQIPVLRNYRHSEMEYTLKYNEARAVVIPWKYRQFDYFEMIQELKPQLPLLEHILIWGDASPPGTLSLMELVSRPLEKHYPSGYLEQKKMPWNEFSLVSITTGTTGMPKFAEHAICALLVSQPALDGISSDDVVVGMSNAPMGPNMAVYIFGPKVAAKVALLEHWSVEEGLKFAEKERATIICVVPTQLVEINSYPGLEKYDLSSLRVIRSAGSILPYHIAAEIEDKLGCRIINQYGAADFGTISATYLSDPKEIRLMSVGHPYIGNEIKIKDDSGMEVSGGEVGRIWARGPRCSSGYYKDPDATAKKWEKDGWGTIGDRGRMDEKGILFVTGRGDDMIIRGGQNIQPTEVENLLLSNSKIKEAAVVGISDPVMGERACACVVLKAGEENFSFGEMTAFLKEKRLAPFKLPEKLLVLESLPYVSGLKLDRKQLKVMVQKELEKPVFLFKEAQ